MTYRRPVVCRLLNRLQKGQLDMVSFPRRWENSVKWIIWLDKQQMGVRGFRTHTNKMGIRVRRYSRAENNALTLSKDH